MDEYVSKPIQDKTVRDGDLLEREAHSLKGSCREMGAEICQQVEGMGETSTFANAAKLIDRLEQEFARGKEELDEYLVDTV